MKAIRDRLEYLVVRLFICFVQSVSLETCEQLAGLLAWLANDCLGVRGKLVEENLRHAFPEKSEQERRRLARRMWRHLLLMVCEIAHAPRKIHDTTWRRYVRFSARREQLRGMLDFRPKMVVTGHFGNFEIGGYMAGLWGFPTFTVARTLDNPHLDAFVRRFRELTGQFILPKQGSSGDVDAVLRAGGLLCLLGDQHAGDKGCWVDFFGRPASCHKALALFTISSGAPMIVTYLRRLDRPMSFEFGELGKVDPQDPNHAPQCAGVPTLTAWYNQRLEAMIRFDPGQYWWLHRRWRTPPERVRQRLAATRQEPRCEAA